MVVSIWKAGVTRVAPARCITCFVELQMRDSDVPAWNLHPFPHQLLHFFKELRKKL